MSTSLCFYILDGHTPVETTDLVEYSEWWATADRKVARTRISEDVEVSTVFLGTNHSILQPGPPILFETLVLGGERAGDMRRYATWDEAAAGHEEECVRLLRGIRGLGQGEQT